MAKAMYIRHNIRDINKEVNKNLWENWHKNLWLSLMFLKFSNIQRDSIFGSVWEIQTLLIFIIIIVVVIIIIELLSMLKIPYGYEAAQCDDESWYEQRQLSCRNAAFFRVEGGFNYNICNRRG